MNLCANRKQFVLFCTVLGIHGILILGPLGYNLFMNRRSAKKEIAFRVKLGGFEPSHAPEVGPPERTRPAPAPAPARADRKSTRLNSSHLP